MNICSAGLRFNRVTGLCDRTENVSCRAAGDGGGGGGVGGASCRPGITEDINSVDGCDMFIPCNEGVPGEPLSCGGTPALHFNPTTGTCDLPENLVPLCVDPETTVDPLPTVTVAL